MLAGKGHFQARHGVCVRACFCHQFFCGSKRFRLSRQNGRRHAFGGLTNVCVELDGSGLLHEPSGDDSLEEEAMCV